MMPTKDEDLDGVNNNGVSSFSGNSGVNNNTGMSKAELRKSNKPIMEKRRRARINHCLNELKSLILEAMKKDPARHTKLEKADILEMTVKHLQAIQRQQLSLAIQTDPTVIHKFKVGFSECAEEVTRYIGQLEGVEQGVKTRLTNHLNNCATGLDQIGTFSNFSAGYRSNTSSTFGSQYHAPNSSMLPLPQDVNNNGRIQMGGIQLIPSRLPSGELALIMPNSTNLPFFSSNMPSQNLDFPSTFPRMSAFSKPSLNSRTSTTHTTTTTTSPPLSPISSISSCGDDSMHTSSDFQVKTPPLPLSQSLSSSFATPSSTESFKFISHSSHLQQPHVSSTSETQKFDKDTRKRLLPDDFSDDIDDEPRCKVVKVNQDETNGNLTKDDQDAVESNSDMWRPW